MPWKIQKQGEMFCVIKESDGKTVKCHPTREKAKSHLAALYVNEPSASKKSVDTGYGLLKSLITERVEELKACGANKPGGGGFVSGNTCARGGGKTSKATETKEVMDMVGGESASTTDALNQAHTSFLINDNERAKEWLIIASSNAYSNLRSDYQTISPLGHKVLKKIDDLMEGL